MRAYDDERRVQSASIGSELNFVVSVSHWMAQRQFVHAFVTSRAHYCNAVYAAATKTVTDKLQRVLNAAARVVSDTRKFDRGLTSLLHDELHWLDVPERVTYKMGVMVYRCLHGQAPRYLADHLITSTDVASRLRLRSANRHQLIVPRCRLKHIRPLGVFDPWSDGLDRKSLPGELKIPGVWF